MKFDQLLDWLLSPGDPRWLEESPSIFQKDGLYKIYSRIKYFANKLLINTFYAFIAIIFIKFFISIKIINHFELISIN